MPFLCISCDGHCSTGYQTTVYGLCPICFAESGHTKETIKLALETYLESSVDATNSVNNLFGDAIEIKAKTNGHKNGSHTAERARQSLALFALWQEVFDHPNAVFDTARGSVINKAFELGFSFDQLRLAVIGRSKSSFKRNNGKPYDRLSSIFKNADTIEQLIEDAEIDSLELDAFEAKICSACVLDLNGLPLRERLEAKRVASYLRQRYVKKHPDPNDPWYEKAITQYATWHSTVQWPGKAPYLSKIPSNWERFVLWTKG